MEALQDLQGKPCRGASVPGTKGPSVLGVNPKSEDGSTVILIVYSVFKQIPE